MKKAIDELMKSVGCDKFPERFRNIYDDAMQDFYANGCNLTNPDYYDEIGDKYNILVKYRDVYKKAAEEVSKNEDLSAFLHLLCYALKDRQSAMHDGYELNSPKSTDGKHNLAYDMITGLAICSLVPYSYDKLKSMGLPDDVIISSMRLFEEGIDKYREKHNGAYGYDLLGWYQLAIDGRLFRVGRLEIEPCSSFGANAIVFGNSKGEQIALADDLLLHEDGFPLGSRGYEDDIGSFTAKITETKTHWKGYPFNSKGYVQKEEISLSKDEWEIVLSPKDKAINLHIPSGGSFSKEVLDDTIKEIKNFMKEYFPQVDYKAFVCHSWIIDTQLEELLGQDSNIVKFGKRFQRLAMKSDGRGVFHFVFYHPSFDYDPVISELPENTRLEKAIKNHYLNNKAIYEMYGYFLAK